CYQYNNGWTF
nr:immunoglobulin light chain junction region [Macaca mulatta]